MWLWWVDGSWSAREAMLRYLKCNRASKIIWQLTFLLTHLYPGRKKWEAASDFIIASIWVILDYICHKWCRLKRVKEGEGKDTNAKIFPRTSWKTNARMWRNPLYHMCIKTYLQWWHLNLRSPTSPLSLMTMFAFFSLCFKIGSRTRRSSKLSPAAKTLQSRRLRSTPRHYIAEGGAEGD